MGLNCNHCVASKRENFLYTDGRGGGNVTMEAETGVMWPQAKEGWQPPEVKRGKKSIPR